MENASKQEIADEISEKATVVAAEADRTRFCANEASLSKSWDFMIDSRDEVARVSR